MAIAVPTPQTMVDATTFGKPVADQLNSLVPTAWANLTLQSPWVNYSGYGSARYRKVGDMVYLMGGVSGGAVSSIITTVPVGFRTVQTFQIPQASWATVGVITINTDGTIGFTSGDNRFIGLVAFWPLV